MAKDKREARIVNGIETPDTDQVQDHADPTMITDQPTFGDVIFSVPANQKVMRSRFGAQNKQIAVADVAVPVLASGMLVNTTIWATLEEKTDGDLITPSIGKPSSRVVKFMDSDHADRFMGHVDSQLGGWTGYDRAYDQAVKALLAPEGSKVTATGKPSNLQSRLVAKVDGKAVTVATRA